ncbi:uncharacterized protein LOC121380760 [Gigantopelta aegis]|uniref:uncharacterized protein LOC121380760 n=1 Tax=Gigantopelta aegis TaxID=1735272 RepID=UPI001B88CE55|nr:uncharacterized protein LOC121380760 [Gigantopelta aegis]
MASWGSPAQGYVPRSPGNQYANTRQTPPRFPQNSPNFRQRGRNSGFSPVQNQNPRQYHPYQQEFFNSPTSPQHRQFSPNGPNFFRTPQPVNRTPPTNMSWSDRSQCRSSPKRLQMMNMKSPRYDHNCNPGGSFNIESYYHTSMLDDPWRDLTPVPVTQSPSTTT